MLACLHMQRTRYKAALRDQNYLRHYGVGSQVYILYTLRSTWCHDSQNGTLVVLQQNLQICFVLRQKFIVSVLHMIVCEIM
jgi:hypothetical protein